MKQITLFTLLWLAAKCIAAQPTTLSGTVTDSRNRPIPGASVSIKDTYDGATTDSIGRFHFSTSESGNQLLMVSFMGYKSWEQAVLLAGTPIVQAVMLKEAPNELTAVIITAGSFEASDQKKATILKPLDIVTTASANADVAAAMKTLPGAQQIGESAELFVRGGEGYETRQFIDGTTVANPFFAQAPNIASRGRFSPFLFKGTVFSTGGYSALYGQAMSSALILESIDLPDQTSSSASLSPLFVGAQYQQLAKNKKSSWGISGGYTNLGLYFSLVKQRPDYFQAPSISNGEANFRIKTSKTGILKFYGTYQRQVLGLRNPDIDVDTLKNSFVITNANIYTNLSYHERLTSRLKLSTGFSYSKNNDDIQQQLLFANNDLAVGNFPPYIEAKKFTLQAKSTLVQARAILDYKFKGLSAIRGGAEYWYSKDQSLFNNFSSVLQDHFTAGFAEADVYISNRLAFRAGLRAEHSSLLNNTNVAPRASLSYKLAAGEQLTADYGIFYQKPQSQYLIFNQQLPQMRADHYIITYQKMSFSRVFRTQLFQKNYKQLIKFDKDTGSNGNGYARGVELFWRDKTTFKNIDYWITYSYIDTKRDYLNFPYTMQPNFAANHTANLVVKRFFTKMNTQINLNYQYASGRPYYNIAFDRTLNKYMLRDNGRTIPYQNLSISLNYLAKIGKANSVFVFSMNNVLNSRQVFGYSYSYDGATKIATQPPANRFIFFGVFLSWGVDRTQDAINNNL